VTIASRPSMPKLSHEGFMSPGKQRSLFCQLIGNKKAGGDRLFYFLLKIPLKLQSK